MKSMKKYLLIAAALLSLASCTISKKYVYLQDMKEGEKYAIEQFNQAVVHTGDKLDIVVTCKNPELAIPFNNQSGVVGLAEGQLIDGAQGLPRGYKVDSDGFILFPVLGRLHVEGMTLKQTEDMIKALIADGNYIKDPTVTIEFLNFKFVTWGAIGNGVHTVEGDKITIIEALAMSGGVPFSSRNDNIMVLREIDGHREIYKMDLKTKDLFNNPGYYLQQNDIVYVEPRFKVGENARQTFNTVLGTMSTITGFVLLMWNLGYRR